MKISLNLKNPKVRNPLIVIFITAVIALLWHQYFYTPSMETLVSLQKTETKQDTLRTILALKPQLDVLRMELAKSQVKLDSLKSIFPDHKEIPKLLERLMR